MHASLLLLPFTNLKIHSMLFARGHRNIFTLSLLTSQTFLLSLAPISSYSAGLTLVSAQQSPPQQPIQKPFSSMAQDSSSPSTSDRAKQLISDAQDLFSAKPSHTIFQRSWSPDAIFEDPICYATGARQYKAQWWGMPAAFSKSELLAWHVVKDEPSEVQYVSLRTRASAVGETPQRYCIHLLPFTCMACRLDSCEEEEHLCV